MKNLTTLVITENQHLQIKSHLFPNDGFEAAAILICGHCGVESLRLTVEQIICVPYSDCKNRTRNSLNWPGDFLEKALDESTKTDSTIILLHSHPGGHSDFSEVDNASDNLTIPSLQHGSNSLDIPHGSAIFLPSGRIKGRLYNSKMVAMEISRIMLIGENIREISTNSQREVLPFTSQMTEQLSVCTACIVGASGTGSITAEMLARLGIGRLILVDFDRVEEKNLNRIVNATEIDAKNNIYKTTVLKRAILSHHPKTSVTTVEKSIADPEAIRIVSDADFIFCCVDSIEGRYYCDLMAQAFVSPLIDMGVAIPTRKSQKGEAAIADVLGRIDYVFPDGPTLFDKEVISSEGLRSEHLSQVDHSNYLNQLKEGYIRGHIEEAPSVISLNMRVASAAVNEWLSRFYKIRHAENSHYSQTIFSLADCEEEHMSTRSFDASQNNLLGRGLRKPLLDLHQFSKQKKAA